VTKKQSVDLVRIRASEDFSVRHMVPLGQPGVEDAVHDDLGDGLVIGMDA
jgi:hypothetical protein